MSEYYQDQLPNGMQIVTVEMPHLHSAEVVLYVRAGSRDERPELGGISHFIEHMLFRGTRDLPDSFHLERAFEAVGGAVNASTDAESTCYHSRVHPAHLDRALELFASMVRRPLLCDMEIERKVILEEAMEDLNEKGIDICPDNHIADLHWNGHSLSLPILGSRESIAALCEQDLRDYLRLHYVPGNFVLAVSGRIGRDAVLASAQKHFADWAQAPVPQRKLWAAPPPEKEPRIRFVKDSGSQVSVQLSFLTIGRHHEDALLLRTLGHILSWGGTSRLMLRLREQLGLTYAIGANMTLFDECGNLCVDFSVAPEKLEESVREVLLIFEGLCRDLVEEQELAAVVRNLLFDLEFGADQADVLAARYGWGLLVGKVRTLQEERERLALVTTEDLRAAARRHFAPHLLCAVVIGPYGAAHKKSLKKQLLSYGQGL